MSNPSTQLPNDHAPADADQVSIAPGAHPPVVAGEVVSPVGSRSTWPTVVGVISMVLGAMGTLNALWVLVWGLGGAWFLRSIGVADNPKFAASYQNTQESSSIVIGNGALALVFGCLLIYSGLRLNQRRRVGVRASRFWAWGKIVFTIFQTATSAYLGSVQFDVTKEQMSAPGMPPFMASLLGPLMVAGYFIAFFWLIAYPVFMLAWLGRARVRDDVATWPT